MKVGNKLFLFLIVSLFLVSFVSAVPPVQSTFVADEGLEIGATNFQYLEQNHYHTFRFRVYNASNNVYINPVYVRCSMGIIDEDGDYVFQMPNVTTTAGYVFIVNVTGGNFTRLGYYHHGINCQRYDLTAGGYLPQSFEVISSDIGKGFVGTLGFYIILLIISLMLIIIGYSVEDEWLIILGAFGFILLGLFILLYGIVGVKDAVYTYSFGIITIMAGAYFAVRGALSKLTDFP